jgi:hypothetical protein
MAAVFHRIAAPLEIGYAGVRKELNDDCICYSKDLSVQAFFRPG